MNDWIKKEIKEEIKEEITEETLSVYSPKGEEIKKEIKEENEETLWVYNPKGTKYSTNTEDPEELTKFLDWILEQASNNSEGDETEGKWTFSYPFIGSAIFENNL